MIGFKPLAAGPLASGPLLPGGNFVAAATVTRRRQALSSAKMGHAGTGTGSGPKANRPIWDRAPSGAQPEVHHPSPPPGIPACCCPDISGAAALGLLDVSELQRTRAAEFGWPWSAHARSARLERRDEGAQGNAAPAVKATNFGSAPAARARSVLEGVLQELLDASRSIRSVTRTAASNRHRRGGR